jgi:hypothetical protein
VLLEAHPLDKRQSYLKTRTLLLVRFCTLYDLNRLLVANRSKLDVEVDLEWNEFGWKL